MPSLIENIIDVEKRATDIVAAAHAKAKTIAQEADADVARVRADIADATQKRIAQYRVDVEAATQEALAAVEREFDAACASIERVDAGVQKAQVARIVAQVREA